MTVSPTRSLAPGPREVRLMFSVKRFALRLSAETSKPSFWISRRVSTANRLTCRSGSRPAWLSPRSPWSAINSADSTGVFSSPFRDPTYIPVSFPVNEFILSFFRQPAKTHFEVYKEEAKRAKKAKNPFCLFCPFCPFCFLFYLSKRAKSKSVGRHVVNRFEYVFDLRQGRVLDVGRVSHEAIERGHAFDGRVELVEEFVGDARGDLGAVAPRDEIFVNDDHAVGLP